VEVVISESTTTSTTTTTVVVVAVSVVAVVVKSIGELVWTWSSVVLCHVCQVNYESGTPSV